MFADGTQHRQERRNRFVWLMWGLLAFAYLISYFHRLSLAVVMDHLIVDLQIGEAAMAGALAGSYAVIYMIMQIPTGFLVDSWGPRKTVTAGMIVASAGSFIFALAPVLSLAFLGRSLVGLGVSVIFVSVLKFLVNWFKASQFATMTGITGLVGNLGVALGTTPLAILVVYFGWRQTFVAIAITTMAVALACWLIVRDIPSNHTTSEVAGRNNNMNQATPSPSAQPSVTFPELLGALRKVFRNFHTWPLFASAFGLYGTLFAFTGAWSVTYLMQVYGFERGQAANFMLVLTVGIIIGLPLTGYLSDRLGRRRLPLLVIFAVYTAIWALFFAWNGKPPLATLYPLFFIMGLAGGTGAIILPLSKEINDPAFAGIALSIVNIGPFAGTAFLQPLMGYMLDLRWDGLMTGGMKLYPLASYRLLFGACLITLLVSFFFALVSLKETNCRNIYEDGEKEDK